MAQSRSATEKILRVALYPRVSTEEQFLRGYSLQTQEEVLTQYAHDHGYKIVGVYRDEGHSARKPALKRKVMQELLADVQAGKIDRRLFIKLDRWFRNVREYHKIQEILEANNVTWQATMEDYNTATADGRLKVNICFPLRKMSLTEPASALNSYSMGSAAEKNGASPEGLSSGHMDICPKL